MESTPFGPQSSPQAAEYRWPWGLWWAVLLPCLYLPSLSARFDFIDDGNLVYPSPEMPWGNRLELVWHKIVANYEHLGPFRPVLWAHWEVQADLLAGSAFAWRLLRIVWTALSAGLLLTLMRALAIRPTAAVMASALAMWNPYRNEIWMSLTLSEGVAMPYALLGLVCAVQAARSSRPWKWDIAAALSLLLALGCKNTFAALVPAQMLLRMSADGSSLSEGWKRHGHRAGLLALVLIVPTVHYILFQLNWHPGQYQAGPASWAQGYRMYRTVKGAMSLDLMAPGLSLALLALGVQATSSRLSWRWPFQVVRNGICAVWVRHRVACLAGMALLAFGVAVYLPLNAVSERYSMPAVWGADLCIAALLDALTGVSRQSWRRAAYSACGVALFVVAISNLAKQDKLRARSDTLWQCLEHLEQRAPQGACIGWLSSTHLNMEEGIQLCWHLQHRARTDIRFALLDATGQPASRREVADPGTAPVILLTGTAQCPPTQEWILRRVFTVSYWAGMREFRLYLWGER